MAGKARELPHFTSILTQGKPAEKLGLSEGHPANKFEWTWVCCQAWDVQRQGISSPPCLNSDDG